MFTFLKFFGRVATAVGPAVILLFAATLGWALWFGATISTFVFGWHFFKVLPHEAAGDAANAMFNAFAIFEWIAAAVTVAAIGLMFITWPSKRLLAVIALLILSGGVMITVTLGLMPEMAMLRKDNQVSSDLWKRRHGQSMAADSVQALLLAATAVPLLASAEPVFKRKIRPLDDTGGSAIPKRGGLSQRT
jgi:hypothetical protein